MSVIVNATLKTKSKFLIYWIYRFVISIAPVISSYHTTHFLIFDDYEEVSKLSKEYKTFEEILKNLEFRERELHLKTKGEQQYKYKINKIETRIKLRENKEVKINCKN